MAAVAGPTWNFGIRLLLEGETGMGFEKFHYFATSRAWLVNASQG